MDLCSCPSCAPAVAALRLAGATLAFFDDLAAAMDDGESQERGR